MSKKNIQITTMSSDDTKELFKFLSAQTTNNTLWKANQVYNFNGDQITLSHDIVWRQRKDNKTGSRYEVISPNKIGSGGFGTVYDVEGTLALNESTLELKQNKKRVVKIQNHSFKNPLASLAAEYRITREAPHISVKAPTVINNATSYTVMKKLDGRELFDIILDDLQHTVVLTIEQRLELSIALLKALKEQVSDRGIIHRDLKPENIMVALHPAIKVNIIDFGLSKLVNDTITPAGFTPKYAAPEMFKRQTQTLKTDVFCMARVLGLLWRDSPANYADDNDEAYLNSFNVNYNDLFTGLILSAQNKDIIKSALTKMSKVKLEERPAVEEMIQVFEAIQLNNHTPSKTQTKITKADIEKQVRAIFDLTAALRLKNQDLKDRNFEELGNKYVELATQIELKTRQFQAMETDARQKHIKTYLNECQELIDPVKSEMKNNRDANYILANLGLAIAGLGLFYLIAIACNKASTGNWLFFSKPKSLELAENLEEGLKQVAAAAA